MTYLILLSIIKIMPQVLYRKYRSQNFSQLFGQGTITKIIKQSLIDKKVGHAYLFTGPRGTGKTSMARILAKSLNCINFSKNQEPCNQCPNCDAINQGKSLDLIEIDAASNRGIDEIRALKEKVGFLPVEGGYKVYIIDEVHMLTLEAFNALLKTLEEPPANVVFILATTESHKLPLTIISRTQRFDFKLADRAEVLKKIKYILNQEKIEVAEDALNLITNIGGGSFRDTESLLEKVLALNGYKSDKMIDLVDVESSLGLASQTIIKDFIGALEEKNLELSLNILDKIQQQDLNIFQFLKQVLEQIRIEIIQVIAGKSKFSLKMLFQMAKQLNEAASQISTSTIPVLPLELALINITEKLAENNNSVIVTKVTPKSIEKVEHNDQKYKEIEVNRVEAKSEENAQKVNISVEKINLQWKKVLAEAKKHNHHLAAFLSQAKVVGIEQEIIFLEVPFDFHKKKLEETKARMVLGEIFKQVYDNNLHIKCQVAKKMVSNVNVSDSNSNLVEEVFADII